MGILKSIITNNTNNNNRIGMISNTSLMYFTDNSGLIEFFTHDLQRIIHKSMSINDINNMDMISQTLWFNNGADVLKLYPDINIDMSQYKLINIYHKPLCYEPTSYSSGYIGFIIKLPTLNSIKCDETYYATFCKYKIILNILCLDITNIIFYVLTIVKIDNYYVTELDKFKRKFIDNELKHKFINVMHNNI